MNYELPFFLQPRPFTPVFFLFSRKEDVVGKGLAWRLFEVRKMQQNSGT